LKKGKWIKAAREDREKREGKKPLINDPEEPSYEMSPFPWSKKSTTAPVHRNSHSTTWKDKFGNFKDVITDQFNPTPETRACGRVCCCKTGVVVVCCVGIIVIVALIALIIIWKNKSLFLLI